MLPSAQELPAHSPFSVSAHYNLKWLSPPNIIRTLVPAVATSLKNTAPAFRPIKKPTPAHKPLATKKYMQNLHFYVLNNEHIKL
jgi:hypothetical protein